MTKFVLLYMLDGTAEEEIQKAADVGPESMQDWMTWSERVGSGLVDFGLPLGGGKTVSPSGVSTSGSKIGGYSIVEAADLDAATALLDGHPHIKQGGTIEVLETFAIPGM